MARRTVSEFSFLMEFLNSVQSETQALIFGPQEGKSIFHYTNLQGLQGIVQNHDLWLTHSRYSNDEEEITHGYKIVKEVIDEKRQNALLQYNPEFFTHLAACIKEPTPEGVYICCFCLDDNLLSQWRSYGANGNGVSIGLDPHEFDFITGQDSPHGGLMRLWKVFYDVERQKRIVGQAVDFAYNRLNDPVDERARLAASVIQFFIPTFKNEGFREERECRLIFTPSPGFQDPPKFRVSKDMLVPYYSLKQLGGSPNANRMLPITRLTIGPCVNKKLNTQSAQMLLTNSGYTSVIVDSSNTPYRG